MSEGKLKQRIHAMAKPYPVVPDIDKYAEEYLLKILDEAKQKFPWLGRKDYIEEGWSQRDDEDDCYLILAWFKECFGSAKEK